MQMPGQTKKVTTWLISGKHKEPPNEKNCSDSYVSASFTYLMLTDAVKNFSFLKGDLFYLFFFFFFLKLHYFKGL